MKPAIESVPVVPLRVKVRSSEMELRDAGPEGRGLSDEALRLMIFNYAKGLASDLEPTRYRHCFD
jgi:hypothetical protein